MKPDWTEKDIDRYGGMTLRDVVDICEQLRVDNDRLNRNETLYRAKVDALKEEVAELRAEGERRQRALLSVGHERDILKQERDGIEENLEWLDKKVLSLAEDRESLENDMVSMGQDMAKLQTDLAHTMAILVAEKQDHANTIRFFSKLLLDAIEGD